MGDLVGFMESPLSLLAGSSTRSTNFVENFRILGSLKVFLLIYPYDMDTAQLYIILNSVWKIRGLKVELGPPCPHL